MLIEMNWDYLSLMNEERIKSETDSWRYYGE